jgi:hypothetical protein
VGDVLDKLDWNVTSRDDGADKLADVLVVDGDVLEGISILEDRRRFVAVIQGGSVRAGWLCTPSENRAGRSTEMAEHF